MRSWRSLCSSAITAALIAGVVSTSERARAGNSTLQVVAYSTEQAPGLAVGTTYGSLSTVPSLNDAGIVLYANESLSQQFANGVWIENHGAESLVYSAGMQAPGVPTGEQFQDFLAPYSGASGGFRANDSGKIVLTADTNAYGGSYTDGIWSSQNGAFAPVVLVGNSAPGYAANSTFEAAPISAIQPTYLWFNDEGDIAFIGEIQMTSSPNYSIGIWSTTGGSLHVVAGDGTSAPGVGAGVTFSFNGSPGEASLNPKGQVAFFGEIQGPGVVLNNNNTGLWAQNNGTLALVARVGDQAPGMPAGTTFTVMPYGYSNNAPGFNAAGQVAFDALFGSGETAGVWAGEPGALQLVAASGQQAPGTSPGTVFATSFFATFGMPVINHSGAVAFDGQVSGAGVTSSNNDGIWDNADGQLTLIARTGDQAPGAPSGADFTWFAGFVLNSEGQVAFEANTTAGQGIWAQNRDGQLTLIALTGQPIEYAPDEFIDPSQLTFADSSGNEDGQPSGFNDLGQVAFMAVGSNNISAIFISDAAGVPEPASVLLLGVGLIVAGLARCLAPRTTGLPTFQPAGGWKMPVV